MFTQNTLFFDSKKIIKQTLQNGISSKLISSSDDGVTGAASSAFFPFLGAAAGALSTESASPALIPVSYVPPFGVSGIN